MSASARKTPVLTTERLKLRARTLRDAEALHPSFADPELMRWWSHGPHETIEQTREDFSKTHGEWRCWAITLKGDRTAIGFVAAGERRQGNVTEIGYMLARAHWGTGIAPEAVSRVIDHILVTEGQRRVFADTDPENIPSRALLEKLGFTLEGLLRSEWETHLGVRDTTLYGLLREDWVR
ncbi:GNAT family protein [Sphingomonas sp. G-3-2-10]|uniref:GNAT family N-acetyltransferase n=1 Tax=Sphingomonas sp. G-3-2-10 TaxID=2728838 RepID=UPI00146E1F9D|nr:GNAT family N-acetyltransferase [Sphingomonas sp. G-3-2-10]